MKDVHQFSFSEWLYLTPVKAYWKEKRNDWVLSRYLQKKVPEQLEFLAQNHHLKAQKVLLVIAFEQVKVLDWLMQLGKKNIQNYQLMVFDNSKSQAKRHQIKQLCDAFQIPYLGLPPNRTTHPNRSHGMAMTWVYNHVVKIIEPQVFGFLDHDMIPVKPISEEGWMSEQSCYGVLNTGFSCWNLWAGYSFFQYQKVKDLPLNFLYDFSRGVDTGGRNWLPLYSQMSEQHISFAQDEFIPIRLSQDVDATVQLIDHTWIHIGGVSYNNNFQPKEVFYEKLVHELLAGRSFNEFK